METRISHDTRAVRGDRNDVRKQVGFAIHGLRAHIKAIELAEGKQISANDYRYEISPDRDSARIVRKNDGSEVAGTNLSRAQWAELGKRARAGLIGLKAEKESYRAKGEHIQYTLNVIANEAYLYRDGKRIEGQPQSIVEWAQKGHEVERKLYESLKAADDHDLQDVSTELRKEMIRLGIIREPRTHNAESQSE